MQKYRQADPERYITARNRWQAVRRGKIHEKLGIENTTQCRCAECGTVYDREAAKDRGYRFMGRYSCVCNECAHPE